MDYGVKRIYKIKCKDSNEALRIRDSFHYQLKGNDDYYKSNIILNDSETRRDGTVNEVHVYIFDECTEIPKLLID